MWTTDTATVLRNKSWCCWCWCCCLRNSLSFCSFCVSFPLSALSPLLRAPDCTWFSNYFSLQQVVPSCKHAFLQTSLRRSSGLPTGPDPSSSSPYERFLGTRPSSIQRTWPYHSVCVAWVYMEGMHVLSCITLLETIKWTGCSESIPCGRCVNVFPAYSRCRYDRQF